MALLISSILLSVVALLLGNLLGKTNPGKSSGFTAGIIVILLLLPATFFLPKLKVEYPVLANAYVAESSQKIPWEQIILYSWAIGSAILLCRLALHYRSVTRWRRNSKRCSSPEWTSRLHECCSLLKMDTIPSLGLSKEISSPVVTGLIYPQILLPSNSEEWSEDTINHVLLHELGHVKRRDLWISVASHIVCALHWFNPLVWLIRKQQATQCEFACDSFVLSSGANPKCYVHAICDVAETASGQHRVALALAMANKASLRQRVEILMQDQKPSGKILSITALALTSSAAIAMNLIQPSGPHSEIEPPINNKIKHPSEEEIKTRMNANPFPGNRE